ncbi:hypothetical protein [Metabacillus litoralis]|uniref:hypothetical protein n=1 Tax=Metabacillus litoralis TaxID=152268 RepID=UPI00203CA3B0|nr:hypothetical protein [Metabacillus litoralis]MCM3165117.1 hypothetical protein [Metabacillus litoralis]
MYAIKINDKHLLLDIFRFGEDTDQVLTFSTEKKAVTELEFIKKQPKWENINLKVIEVEEQVTIDPEKGIYEQKIIEI